MHVDATDAENVNYFKDNNGAKGAADTPIWNPLPQNSFQTQVQRLQSTKILQNRLTRQLNKLQYKWAAFQIKTLRLWIILTTTRKLRVGTTPKEFLKPQFTTILFSVKCCNSRIGDLSRFDGQNINFKIWKMGNIYERKFILTKT